MTAIVTILAFAICVYICVGNSQSNNIAYVVKVHTKERERCFKKVGIGSARAINIENGSAKDIEQKDNCYVSCLLKGNKIINEEGIFDMNSVITKSAPEGIPKTIKSSAESCKKSVKIENCMLELDLFNCIKKAVEKKYPVEVVIKYGSK